MKKNIMAMALTGCALSVSAQDISLPAPDLSEKSMSVVEALKTRHSVREFDATKELSNQQISNLCWAAFGMSRDDNHRTAPTAMNRQEIRLFVFTKAGVYEYDAKANKLIKKADGDKRELMASNGGNAGFRQDFVLNAPVSLLVVIDYNKFGSSDEKATMMCCVDAGNISENINLYCQAVGLATVPRATHDTNSIKALLELTDKQLPIMNNPVGYAR
jgi:SagB-type dehydrogenase family enzyme